MLSKLKLKLLNLGQNNKIILKNSIGAFLIKGLALIISFISTPIFIDYFNDNRVLGIWYTLLSVLVWFLSFDLGIGNGIRNQLVHDFASNDYDSAKITLSSGFLSMFVVTIVLFLFGFLLLSNLNLNAFFNIEEGILSKRTLFVSSVVIFGAIMLRFLLTCVHSIFYALQKSAINNLLALCVSILQLVYILLFRFENAEDALINLSWAFLVISNLPIIIAAFILFYGPLKKCIPSIESIKKARVKNVLGVGVIFFYCQIMYMLIVNTNEFLVTYLYDSASTVEYSFYYKLTSIIAMLVTLAMTPIWSVVTKALAEKDFLWLNLLYKRIKKMGILVIGVEFMIVPFLQLIMDLWLGRHSIPVNIYTAMAFACFGGTFVYSSMLSTIVCGMARMKLQAICYTIGILFKFTLVFFCSQMKIAGWDIIVWSNVLVLFPYIIAQQVDLNVFFSRQLEKK